MHFRHWQHVSDMPQWQVEVCFRGRADFGPFVTPCGRRIHAVASVPRLTHLSLGLLRGRRRVA